MDISAALPTFVITLREGVEAALVVGIVLACLQKSGKSYLNTWVYLGILAGLVGSVLTGFLLNWTLNWVTVSNATFEPIIEPLLKSGLCLTAIVMLSWMLIWMTQQARSLKSEIEGSLISALQKNGKSAGWGVFMLILIAVLREGFETVLFIFTNLQQGTAGSVGAIAGLIGATGIGFGLFKFGVRINIRRFFQVMGIFLLLIVSGLVVSVCKNLDAAAFAWEQMAISPTNLCFAQDSCLLGPQLWDTSRVLSDHQFPGLLFKALLGYRDQIYLGQAVAYGTFLFSVGTLYLRSLQPQAVAPTPSKTTAL
ncbi:FTR1 family iron permease [Acaryochloris marina]|uniref:Iron permease FTR1, putative n=1 Tax=Acaryochloris marina (strain MBIC 11017) TaxID=329726 RepID=B0C9V7_ACAM1|nr:FTR1 family protein [Acaryochloris marina]ABW25397.1 iron permease FTR1, putative [Acaryochloris marina MBIC11017]